MTLIRPGPTALDWLAQTVDALQAGDPLRPVTIVVPTALFAGRLARWRLAERRGLANVRTLRLADLAARLARPVLGDLPLLTGPRELGAVRAALTEAGGPLQALAHHPSLYAALIGLFRELRRRELDPADLAPDGAAAAAALDTYRVFRRLAHGDLDPTALRRLAADHLAGHPGHDPPAALADLGCLVPYLLTRLDPVDVRLLALAAQWVPVRAAFAAFDDPLLEDRQPLTGARALAAALGLPAPSRLRAQPEHAATSSQPELRVLRAPDPVEEVKAVLRGVCADLESGVPLHRMAILYRQPDPYAAILAESLRLAEIPFASLDGRPLAETRPGRLLLSLLWLPDRGFARQAVLDWVDGGPALPEESPPAAATWDRLSRAANIVRGASQWRARLDRLAAALDRRVDRLDRRTAGLGNDADLDPIGDGADERLGARRDAETARRIAALIGGLEAALQPPADGSSWRAFADWLDHVRATYAEPAAIARSGDTEAATHDDTDVEAAEAVAALIRELAEADALDGHAAGATRALVLATLETTLTERTLPVGRFGTGILIGSVRAVAGLSLDRVALLGLVEGGFPPPPDPDPFWPDPATDPLDRPGDAQAVDRLAVLSALAAADGGRVTLGVPDAIGDRRASPARWLLELLPRDSEAPPHDAASFTALREADHPWLRVIHSAQDGLRHARVPLDREDRRLVAVARWINRGRPLADHVLARRGDLPLGRTLVLRAAREGPDLTPFDGYVGALADPGAGPPANRLPHLLAGTRVLSASAVETWARCPYSFFLRYVLDVVPTEQPDDAWSMAPQHRGALVHRILRRVARDRLRRREDMALETVLARAATEAFAVAEAEGVSGHPLAWEGMRAAILEDVTALVREDATLRSPEPAALAYVEQAFGTGDADAWPPLTVPAEDGRCFVFAGVIDRVDVAPGAALVLDYKTGSAEPYRDLAADPCLAGQHVQLALYAQVVAEQLGGSVPIHAAYRFVSPAPTGRDIALPADPARVSTRLHAVLTSIAQGIAQGAFPAVPGEERNGEYAHCRLCAYDRVCAGARDLQWARKQADPACVTYLQLALPTGAPTCTP